jgi:hypothetical protein
MVLVEATTVSLRIVWDAEWSGMFSMSTKNRNMTGSSQSLMIRLMVGEKSRMNRQMEAQMLLLLLLAEGRWRQDIPRNYQMVKIKMKSRNGAAATEEWCAISLPMDTYFCMAG